MEINQELYPTSNPLDQKRYDLVGATKPNDVDDSYDDGEQIHVDDGTKKSAFETL